MLSLTATILLGTLAGQAVGSVHHMFSGAFSGSTIYAIEFDDESNSLTLVNNITSNSSSSKWIAIDVCWPALWSGYRSQNPFRKESKTYMSVMGLYMIATPSRTALVLSIQVQLPCWVVVCYFSSPDAAADGADPTQVATQTISLHQQHHRTLYSALHTAQDVQAM
mgnify:CR=1 FL=1